MYTPISVACIPECVSFEIKLYCIGKLMTGFLQKNTCCLIKIFLKTCTDFFLSAEKDGTSK